MIRGNNLILKCKIPSFVADFLQIIAWVDSDGQEYTPQTTAHGKKCLKKERYFHNAFKLTPANVVEQRICLFFSFVIRNHACYLFE